MERIYEMANRRKRQTGLPINIWIDENGWYKLGGHDKRIKVQMNYSEKMQNQPFCCMDLYGNIIEDTFDEKECEVSTKDLRQVSNYVLNNFYAYVLNNFYALDKVADEEIFMEDYDEISIKGGKLASEEEIDNLIKEVDARIK